MIRVEQAGGATDRSLAVLNGTEAVSQTERAICGAEVAHNPAMAEGLALTGQRAASVYVGDGFALFGGGDHLAASCVHHVGGTIDSGVEHQWPFELAPESVQEAIDHTLVAHLLSARLGRAGLCTMGSGLAADLGPVQLLGPKEFTAALASPGSAEPDAGPTRVLQMVTEALARVAKLTGRALDKVRLTGADDSEIALVVAGPSTASARAAAEAMRKAGVATSVLSVLAVQPFPEHEVRKHLAKAKKVVVVSDIHQGSVLTDAVRKARGSKVTVVRGDGSADGTLAALKAALAGTHKLDTAAIAESTKLASRLIAAPAGPWAEEMTRRAAAAFSGLGRVDIANRTRREDDATVLDASGLAIANGKASTDILFLSSTDLLTHDGPIASARPGGTVLVLANADSSEQLAREMEPELRELVEASKLDFYWLNPADLDRLEPEDTALDAMTGAALLSRLVSESTTTISTTVQRIAALTGGAAVIEGSAKVQRFDKNVLDPKKLAEEHDFRAGPVLVRLPQATGTPDSAWTHAVNAFHLHGAEVGAPPANVLRPAALTSLTDEVKAARRFPFAVVADDEGQPQALSLVALLADAHAGAGGASALAEHLDRIAYLTHRALAKLPAGTAVRTAVGAAAADLPADLGLSGDAAQVLSNGLAALVGGLHEDVPLLDLGPDAPVHLYLEATTIAQATQRGAFIDRLGLLAEKLRDLLLLDRLASSEGRSPEAVKARVGGGGSLINLSGFAKAAAVGQSGGLEPTRRARVETALATLEAFLADTDASSGLTFVSASDVGAIEGQRWITHPDPLSAAVGVFDGLALKMADVFKAARTAELEANGAYVPELHDVALSSFGWQAFSAQELRLTPTVAVVIDAARLRKRDQGSLTNLIRSSRPVQVLILDDVDAPDEAADLSRFRAGLGQLAVAHREAFVVESTLARPERLVASIAHMATAMRPAVMLVSRPTADPISWRPLRAEAALLSRACPEFTYDPDAGQSWAERFDISANPQPDELWSQVTLDVLGADGPEELVLSLTWADAVALEGSYQHHFRAIPVEAWDNTQVSMAEYVERYDPNSSEVMIPFIWVMGDNLTLQRALITRELAVACVDRARGWRVQQELGGYKNVFADRAAQQARDAALAEAQTQMEALQTEHADALDKVGSEAAHDAMERLAAVLMNADSLAMAPMASPRTASAPSSESSDDAPAEVAEAAPAEVEEEEEEEMGFDEAYIDTFLCTSCNDCINLNQVLFTYNADKQAQIGDINGGTFAELVKAAEGCPAKCIHPGKPLAGDSTATPDLIARAARLG